VLGDGHEVKIGGSQHLLSATLTRRRLFAAGVLIPLIGRRAWAVLVRHFDTLTVLEQGGGRP
jgi:hypothetical protein